MTSKAEKADAADKQLKTQQVTRLQSTATVANNNGRGDASSRHHTIARAANSSGRRDVSGAVAWGENMFSAMLIGLVETMIPYFSVEVVVYLCPCHYISTSQ